MFNEFGILDITPIPLKCNNQAAIHISSNPIFQERTKHIELNCYFVREKLLHGLISLHHVSAKTTSECPNQTFIWSSSL